MRLRQTALCWVILHCFTTVPCIQWHQHLTVWNLLWWENLHHGNWQTWHTMGFIFLANPLSKLANTPLSVHVKIYLAALKYSIHAPFSISWHGYGHYYLTASLAKPKQCFWEVFNYLWISPVLWRIRLGNLASTFKVKWHFTAVTCLFCCLAKMNEYGHNYQTILDREVKYIFPRSLSYL